jgi:hypothetical protein
MALGGSLPDADSFVIGRSPAGSFSFSNLFKLSSSGAATFSSSVTAANGYFGPTSNQVRITSQASFQNATLNAHIINGDGTGAYLSGDLLLQPRSSSGGGANIIAFGTSNNTDTVVERMRITSGGLVLIGATSALINESSLGIVSNGNTATFKSTLNGGNPLLVWNTASGSQNQIQFFTGSSYTSAGSITSNGSVTSYNVTSDYRLKQDFKPFNGLDLVSKIKVYDYEWKSDNSRMNGVIAHELQEVVPYAVSGEKDAKEMQQVDYSKLVPILVQAIQELKAEIEILKQNK